MNLFDRVPAGLFSPLTGVNKRRAWELIARLANDFYGPDSVPPFPDGYLHEQITKEIERFLVDQAWEREDGQQEATPLNIQSNMLLRRLVDSGWLVEDRVGARLFVSMPRTVSRFFETLQQFAEEGPQHIGGSIQMVHNQLLGVSRNPREQAQGFMTAASQCVRLINDLSNTTLRARDLMKDLTKEHDTTTFVRRFFEEHIAELYVRDFKELRTENHPLRLRWEIVDLVKKVSSEEPARTELLSGYAALAKSGEVPGEMLERDVQRFERLLDVERFLERMDRVMEQATQRAIAFLGYRLKATDRIEAVIDDTLASIDRAERLGRPIEGLLMPPHVVISEGRLTLPAPAPPRPLRAPMRKREMSVRERAMLMLRREMTAHRDGTPKAMQKYVKSRLPNGGAIEAEAFSTDVVEDAVAYLAFLRLGAIAKNNPRAFAANPLLKRLGFEVELGSVEDRVATSLFETRSFVVRRTGGEDAA